MSELWRDIVEHPRASILFLLYQAGVWSFAFMTSSAGLSSTAVLLLAAAPAIAGGMVAFWRLPAREGLLVGRTRLAGAPLAAALVSVATISAVFMREAATSLLAGDWQSVTNAEFVLGWAFASVLFAVLSLVVGLFGGFVTTGLAALFKARGFEH